MRAHLSSALVLLAGLCSAGPAAGAEVRQSEVTNDSNRYSVRFDVHLDAKAPALRERLMAYADYSKHFQSIKESRVLGRQPDGSLRVRLRIYGCALFFCRTLTVVKDISETPDKSIVAHMDPKQSSFSEGVERWRIEADGEGSRLSYRAELVPGFYVPPLVGPWILKRQLREMLHSSAVKLEALAGE